MGRPFHALFRWLLACFLLGSVAVAQGPPASSGLSLRTETTLVQVPVIVTDRQGHPVSGLKKEDFLVREDGKPQRIAVFEHIQHAAAPSIKLKVPEGVFTNRVEQNGPARLTIIAIDAVGTGITEQQAARREILDFISKNVSVDQPVALVMLGQNKVKVLHDFTTDPRILIAAIRNIVSGRSDAASIAADDAIIQTNPNPLNSGMANLFNQMAAAETDTIQTAFQTFMVGQQRTMVENSLDAFNEIARAFAGIPGRKSLIWITNGQSMASGDLDIAASMDMGQTVSGTTALPNVPRGAEGSHALVTLADTGPQVNAYFERAWRLLNDSNIAVYPLDISEVSNPALTNPALRVRSGLKRPANNLARLEQFAGETGGSVCLHTTDLDNCFRRAGEDSQDYYMLAYYADPANKKTDWRRIQVSLDKRDVKLRARAGYYPRQPKLHDKKMPLNAVLSAIGSPLEFTSLPLEVRLDRIVPSEGDAGKQRVNFVLFVPPTAGFIAGADNHMDLTLAAVAKLPDARPVGQFVRQAAGALKPQAAADLSIHGFALPGSMDLAPGDYELKCVVRDNQNGHMGTVTVPVKVEAPQNASRH